MPKMLSKKEFADRLGVSEAWVRTMLGRAEFQKHQRGKYVVITSYLKRDLETFLENKIDSTQTCWRTRRRYICLLNENLSCLD